MARILYFMPILYIIFITQKLDATAKNRFQILTLHPKNICLKKKYTFFNAYSLDKYLHFLATLYALKKVHFFFV